MPGVIEADAISADSENGILTIRLPKKPETQPKKINVNVKSTSKVIDNEG